VEEEGQKQSTRWTLSVHLYVEGLFNGEAVKEVDADEGSFNVEAVKEVDTERDCVEEAE
jgi:hypothetical protein